MATNKKLKKTQKKVNKVIKNINNNILNDFLWNGRFIVTQEDRNFLPCGIVLYKLKFTDLRTNRTYSYWRDDYDILYGVRLWLELNDFIIRCRYENDKADGVDPYEDKTIYRTK